MVTIARLHTMDVEMQFKLSPEQTLHSYIGANDPIYELARRRPHELYELLLDQLTAVLEYLGKGHFYLPFTIIQQTHEYLTQETN